MGRHGMHMLAGALLALVTCAAAAVDAGGRVIFRDPLFQDLEALREASTIPVTVQMSGGFPRALAFDVQARGFDAGTAARRFVASYPDLFRQGAPRTGGGPDETLPSELLLRSIYPVGPWQVVAFSQTLGGVPVFGANLSVHVAGSGLALRITATSGALLPRQVIDVTPRITQQEAEDIAVGLVPSAGGSGEVIGVSTLMIHDPMLAGGSPDPRLVWSVTVEDAVPLQLLIDAHTGAEVLRNSLGRDSAGLKDYDLYYQDAHGGNIMDTTCFNPTTLDEYIGDEDGVIEKYANNLEVGYLWWYLRWTYQFFHDVFGRHSYDDDDEEIEAYIYSVFGGGGRYVHTCGFEFEAGVASMDVVVHEYTHAITWLSSQFVYANQSGALDESYADTMAAVADQDWLLGEDSFDGTGAFRSLADPLNGPCGTAQVPCNDPDRMSLYCTSDEQCNFTGDNGGVHTNSGIPNKAHYLMSEGGSHNGVTVANGMGRAKLGQLIYHAMQFLPSQATFADARGTEVVFAEAWAIQGLFGFTAQDACAVRNAWAAVEIGFVDQNCDGIDDAADGDGDGIPDLVDVCPDIADPLQADTDMDGIGDPCDDDADGDSCPDEQDNCPGLFTPCTGVYLGSPDTDGDGQGDACDTDDDNDGIADVRDNCPWEFNPDQFDGNRDGNGDACDPDLDGDGFYLDTDNCPFVANPDQADRDGDGLGDACDDCPNVSDNAQAYTPGFPELGIDPAPLQPDSDGDGTPDACDDDAFGAASLKFDRVLFNPTRSLAPTGEERRVRLAGPPGSEVAVPLDVCPEGGSSATGPGQRMELVATDLPASVMVWVSDGLGTRVARFGAGIDDTRGLRFRADCRENYRLHILRDNEAEGTLRFDLVLGEVDRDDPMPWRAPSSGAAPPPPVLDTDDDGRPDPLDNCPLEPNPLQTDGDLDGIGDACDSCDGRGGADCETVFESGFERSEGVRLRP